MPVITSDLVQQLRGKTGAGLMDCKRALEKSAGDMEQAVKILREAGAASAAKRAGRAAANGLVKAYLDPAGKTAALLELNCETDFVARTDDFVALVNDLTRQAAENRWASPADAPQGRLQELAGKLGENIVLRRFARFEKQQPGLFYAYIHPSESVKVGALVELGAQTDKGAASPEAAALAKALSMQIAATAAKWVRREDVPADVAEREKAIGREQAKNMNKPEAAWGKIAEGKLNAFYQEFCLLEQADVRDKNMTVKKLLEEASKKAGEPLTVRRFVRYKVGEDE